MAVQLQSIFCLERGRQGDPISAFLFVLSLEILFYLRLKDWQSLTIATFTQYMLIIQPFALQDTISMKDMINTFFPYFYGLKLSLTKSEIAGICVVKGV